MHAGRLPLLILASLLIGGGALAADPPKKVKPPAADAKKGKDKDKDAPKDDEPPPEPKKRAPPKEEPKEEEASVSASELKTASSWEHPSMRIGVGAQLAPVFSKDTDSYKLISPDLGVSAIIEGAFDKSVYWRIEPTISTFSRKASRVRLVSADATVTPAVITQETITNKTRVYEIFPRLMAGYDFSDMLTARLGVLAGVSFASNSPSVNESSSDACQNMPTGSSFVYGATLAPISVRLGDAHNIEVGAYLEWSKRSITICDRPLPDEGQQVLSGQRIDVVAKGVSKDVSVIQAGVQASVLAW